MSSAVGVAFGVQVPAAAGFPLEFDVSVLYPVSCDKSDVAVTANPVLPATSVKLLIANTIGFPDTELITFASVHVAVQLFPAVLVTVAISPLIVADAPVMVSLEVKLTVTMDPWVA